MMNILSSVKVLLGITGTDLDGQLNLIIETAGNQLLARLGLDEVPEKLEYIVREVSVKRFNRISNEGMASYTQDGESMNFEGAASDFDEFKNDINNYIDSIGSKKGRLRFL